MIKRELVLITILILLIGAVMVIAEEVDLEKLTLPSGYYTPKEDGSSESGLTQAMIERAKRHAAEREAITKINEELFILPDDFEALQARVEAYDKEHEALEKLFAEIEEANAADEDDPFATSDDGEDPFATSDDDEDPFATGPTEPTEKTELDGEKPKDWTQDYDLKNLKTMTEDELTIVWEDWKFGLIKLTDDQVKELERLPFIKTMKIREAAEGSAGDLWDYLTDDVATTAAYLFTAYKQYGNMFSWTSLFPSLGLAAEDVQKRKDELNQKFCVIGGIDKCFKSLVCSSIYDTRAGQSETIARDITGAAINVAHIQGYKIGPITIKGLPRQTLKDWFGNKTVIQGVEYDFTDPNFNSNLLPEQEIYLYQVQYALSNPKGAEKKSKTYPFPSYTPVGQTQTYNLQFKGARTAKWWSTDQRLATGKTTEDNILKYSFTNYNKVCLTFHPGFRSWGYGEVGDPKDYTCHSFTPYAGAPTLITGQPSNANPATQPSGAPGAGV